MSDPGTSHIETLQTEQRKLREIQMVKNFHIEVRFRCIIYLDAQTDHRKLSRNSNGHNFSHGNPIQALNISRRSKLITGSSREIQMVITFHSDV